MTDYRATANARFLARAAGAWLIGVGSVWSLAVLLLVLGPAWKWYGLVHLVWTALPIVAGIAVIRVAGSAREWAIVLCALCLLGAAVLVLLSLMGLAAGSTRDIAPSWLLGLTLIIGFAPPFAVLMHPAVEALFPEIGGGLLRERDRRIEDALLPPELLPPSNEKRPD